MDSLLSLLLESSRRHLIARTRRRLVANEAASAIVATPMMYLGLGMPQGRCKTI
ncbi:hypothetical protein CCACVL1_19582 [Corchorus capsularis]|uniref:Uncharacterized protein n=1 Tax=Corchorus capsularis TaxID=210143 RepID=A0A1R3HG14_COCAP|nr:hypothetical protein CCACVL1_19582 [Corchorus capsularis]